MSKIIVFKKIAWMLCLLALLGFMITRVTHLGYRLVYQVTPSMPKGFYFMSPAKTLHRRDIVIFKPDKATENFLLQHHWIPDNGWMMKYVVAAQGDVVCKKEHRVFINGKSIARVYDFYAPHKRLPQRAFCLTLPRHTYLLMSTRQRRSFDGRYFGPVSDRLIQGKAIYLKNLFNKREEGS